MCTSYLSTVAIAHLYVLFLFCVFTSIPGGAHRSCVTVIFMATDFIVFTNVSICSPYL